MEKNIKFPVWELFVEDAENIGLALVDFPAIEEDFMYFNEQPIKMEFNDEKMMVKGPALIPNKLIYRNDALGERYVYFSEETIVRFVEMLMSKEKNKFNLGHTDNYLDAVLIESYFTQKENEFNIPANSWIVGLKIKDKDAWNRIKSGEFKGFSVESLFSNELVNLMSNKKEQMANLKERVMEALNTVLFSDEAEVKLEDEKVEETPKEETDKVEDEVVIDEAFIDAKIAEAKEAILAEVANLLAESGEVFKSQIKEVDEKVEKFGAEPLAESVKEEVAVPKVDKSNKAAKYFNK